MFSLTNSCDLPLGTWYLCCGQRVIRCQMLELFVRCWFLVIAVHSYAPASLSLNQSNLASHRKFLIQTRRALSMEVDPPLPPTTHTMSICMVPPESATHVWHVLQQTRTILKDPGLYRWPPHVNLLYPFHNIQWNPDSDTLDEPDEVISNLSQKLHTAAQSIEPFQVHLHEFGTFGGKHRGCLWMNPKSFRRSRTSTTIDDDNSHLLQPQEEKEPLIQLQAELEKQFPTCNDVKKASGSFVPHLTVSQLASLDDALAAKEYILDTWGEEPMKYWESLVFTVEEIYLLKRIGDNGQFSKLATIPLGCAMHTTTSGRKESIEFHDPILRFSSMPLYEEDWIRKERKNLKDRRNKNGRKRLAKQLLGTMKEDLAS